MPARCPAAITLALLLLAAWASPGQAIYADQAGQHDWLQQHVGRVSLAAFAAKPRARLFVASRAGAVAALSLKDGSLLWRRVLGEGDAATALQAAGARVLTLSGGGAQLTAWDAATGAAVWAANLAGSSDLAGPDAAALAVVADGKRSLAVAVAAGSAKGFDAVTGELLWTASLPSTKSAAAVKAAPAAAGGAWVASLQPGASRLAVDLVSPTGELVSSIVLGAGAQLSSTQLLLTEAAVAALSADGTQLCSAQLEQGGGSGSLGCQALASLLPPGTATEGAHLVAGTCSQHAALRVAGGAAALALGSGSGAAVTAFVPGAAASGCFRGAAGGQQVAFATPSAAGLETRVLSAADGTAVEAPVSVAGLAPQRVSGKLVGVAELFAAPLNMGGSQAVSQLAVFDDDSLALVRGGAQAWLRHEELASIRDLLFTDLPAPTPENEAQWLASQPSLRQSLAAQLVALKVQASRVGSLPLASPEELRQLERHKAVTSDKLRPTRDPDGFRKQLVVLTAGGKVLALHNGDSRLLWSLDFGPGAGLRKLALWRVPHDVQHDIEVVALAASPDSVTATVMNAHTGKILQTLTAPASQAAGAADGAPDVLPLSQPVHDGTADQHVFVVAPAGTDGAAAVLPDTPAARAAFVAARPGFAFWRVDEVAGAVRGYGFTESGAVEERWSAVLAPPAPAGSSATQQRILALAAHTPGEAVGSPARVLGSGELKFKYLNPNTLLVAVGEPRGARSGHSGGDDSAAAGPRLTVTLLDAVSGRVLFSQTHEDATGPVHAVLSENTAVYHFWGSEAHRWQVASVELFDASPTTLRVSDLAFSETNTTTSSWDVPPIEAGAQTFLVRHAVRGLAATRSARGNTAKQVMLLTTTGQVYLVDRRLLDPRRPIVAPGQKPTPQQAAEGLPPYQPELPLQGPMFATLDRQVARLSGAAVEAAVLESTMLLAAHGLDLFYTRLTPSRSFDMVPDDFPYALLVLILGGLTVATVVLKFITRRTAVKAKWL
ncbi:hypothetical protein ABPG75_013381 [Micractinium tetrahymenae]